LFSRLLIRYLHYITNHLKLNKMNNLTKALLKDLQEDLNNIQNLESNIEVVWALDKLKQNINFTQKEIEEKLRN
jgi:hypothetical protein